MPLGRSLHQLSDASLSSLVHRAAIIHPLHNAHADALDIPARLAVAIVDEPLPRGAIEAALAPLLVATTGQPSEVLTPLSRQHRHVRWNRELAEPFHPLERTALTVPAIYISTL